MLLDRSMKPDLLNRQKQTPLMLAAMHGKIDCVLKLIEPMGYARFVNKIDGKGATPLHLTSRQRRADCVHILLDNGALVCASTGGFGTPLHLAAREGSINCIRELLAWGADRMQRDTSGRILYSVALKYKNRACAALLNPSSAEPLVWSSPLKFISKLNTEAKTLLERALMDANKERENAILKGTTYLVGSPLNSDSGIDDNVSE